MLLVLVNNDEWAFTANKIVLGGMTGNLICITPEILFRSQKGYMQ